MADETPIVKEPNPSLSDPQYPSLQGWEDDDIPQHLRERGLRIDETFGIPTYTPEWAMGEQIVSDPQALPADQPVPELGTVQRWEYDIQKFNQEIDAVGERGVTPRAGSRFNRMQWAYHLQRQAKLNLYRKSQMRDKDGNLVNNKLHIAGQSELGKDFINNALRHERNEIMRGSLFHKDAPQFSYRHNAKEYSKGTVKFSGESDLHVPLQHPDIEALISNYTGDLFNPKELGHDEIKFLAFHPSQMVEAQVWHYVDKETGEAVVNQPAGFRHPADKVKMGGGLELTPEQLGIPPSTHHLQSYTVRMPLLKALAPQNWDKLKEEAYRRSGVDPKTEWLEGTARGIIPFSDTLIGPRTEKQEDMLRVAESNIHSWELGAALVGLVGGGIKVGSLAVEKGIKAGWSGKKIIGATAVADGLLGMAYSHAAPGMVANWAGKPDDDLLNFAEAATISGLFSMGVAGYKWLRGNKMGVVSDELRLLEEAQGDPAKMEELSRRMHEKMVADLKLREGEPRPSQVGKGDIKVDYDVFKEPGIIKEWLSSTGRQTQVKQLQREMVSAVGADLQRMETVAKGLQDSIAKNYDQVTPEIERAINYALHHNSGYGHLHPEVAEWVIKARARIDHMSKQILRGGDIPHDLRLKIEGNEGVYVHRSYQVFEDNKRWVEVIKKEHDAFLKEGSKGQRSLFQQASDYIEMHHGDDIAKRFVEVNEETGEMVFKQKFDNYDELEKAIDTAIEKEVWDLLKLGEKRGSFSYLTESEIDLGKPNLIKDDILKKRGDIPAPIRALWGEITDPVRNTAITLNEMAHLKNQAEMFRRLEVVGRNKLFFRDPTQPLEVIPYESAVRRPVPESEAVFKSTKGGDQFFHGDYFQLHGANDAVDFIYGKGFHVTDSVEDAASVVKGHDYSPNVYSMKLKPGTKEVLLPLDIPVNKMPAAMRNAIARLTNETQIPLKQLLESGGRKMTMRQFMDTLASFARKNPADMVAKDWAGKLPVQTGGKVARGSRLTAEELNRLQNLGSLEDIQRMVFEPLMEAAQKATRRGGNYNGYVYTGPNGQKVKVYFNPDDLIISEVNLHRHTVWPKPKEGEQANFAGGYESVKKYQVIVPADEVGAKANIKTFGSKAEADAFATEWASKNSVPLPAAENAVKLEGVQYGALNGQYTSKWMKEVLDDMDEMYSTNQLMRGLNTVNGLVAMNKTVLSHVTQERNVIGGVVMNLANGRVGLKHVPEAARVSFSKALNSSSEELKEMLAVYHADGLIDESAMGAEAIDFMRNSWFKNFSAKWLADDPSALASLGTRSGAGEAIGTVTKLPSRAYQATDNFFRIVAFEAELARYTKAFSNELASGAMTKPELRTMVREVVLNTYPTYSRVPKGIKAWRQQPAWGNFISFHAEAVRTSFNTFEQAVKELGHANNGVKKIGMMRLAGATAVIGGGPYLATRAWNAATGVSAEEERAVARFAHKWERNSRLMVKKNKDGTVSYMPTSQVNPYGILHRSANAALNTGKWPEDTLKDEIGEVGASFTDAKILPGALIDLTRNSDEFGNEIYSEKARWGDRAADMLSYMLNQTGPGSIASAARFRETLREDPSKLDNETLNNLAGMRIRTFNFNDPANTPLRHSMFRYGSDGVSMQRHFRKQFLESKLATHEDLADAYHKAQYAHWQAQRELYADISAARTLKVKEDLIKRTMLAGRSGLSDKDYNLISKGKFVPFKVPDSILTAARKKGIAIPVTPVGGLAGTTERAVEVHDVRTGKISTKKMKLPVNIMDELHQRYWDGGMSLEVNSVFPNAAPPLSPLWKRRKEPVLTPGERRVKETIEKNK